jgi:hypothetical protein
LNIHGRDPQSSSSQDKNYSQSIGISNMNNKQLFAGVSHWDSRVIIAAKVDWFLDSLKTLNASEMGIRECRPQEKDLIDKPRINPLC